MNRCSRFASGLALFAACALVALPASASSQARIVRLSDVQGSVQINKNAGSGFEHAFLNMPITQGAQLKTLGDGRAEVEFEDGSTMRVTPNTIVNFSTLSLNDSGQRTSAVDLVDGVAYVNWLGKDDFTLNFSREKVALDRAAHFRVDSAPEAAHLAVFKGDVDVNGPSGNLKVEKKEMASFDATNGDKSTVAHKIAESRFDSWDKESIQYHDQYAKNNTASSPYGYGLSDLNYYGSYSDVPGYGLMWQPFFTGVGWDPFMDGAWGFYPGFGYMWASPYPWGWLPYRYGNWMFLPGMGWMWQPGAWNSWNTVPHYTPTTLTTFHAPVPPTGTTKTMLVGRAAGLPTFTSSRLVVNRGSAGMGIPRGSFGSLKDLNHQVAKSGFAEVRSTPQFAASSGRSSGFGSGYRPAGEGPRAAGAESHMGGGMGHAESAGGHASGGGGTAHH
jgi:hypothetical protein